MTANSPHLFIDPSTPGWNLTSSKDNPRTSELRVTSWAYGFQIEKVHLSCDYAPLVKIPDYKRGVEVIDDSLSSGFVDTLEGISSWSWGLA